MNVDLTNSMNASESNYDDETSMSSVPNIDIQVIDISVLQYNIFFGGLKSDTE